MYLFPDFSTFLKIGNMSIRYYALLILLGAIFAYLLGQYRFKQLGYSKDILSDYFVSVLVIGIIGARIWYVIFMFKESYLQNPLEIFAIWHGGLAIQGGLFTGLIYSYYYFKKKNIPFLVAGDAILPGVLIAQACGRWGNFFNQEAFGGVCSLEFLKSLHLPNFIISHMYIDGAYRQPTFLYESLWCFIALVILLLIRNKLAQSEVFATYLILYGVERFIVEGMRTDSLYLGSLRVSQVLSLVFVVGSLIYLIVLNTKFKDKKILYRES